MQGAEERLLRRMSNTPQVGAIEGNAADDILLVDQGHNQGLTFHSAPLSRTGIRRFLPFSPT